MHRKTRLGIYLLKVAQLWEAMDTEAEVRLLKQGLRKQGLRSRHLDSDNTSEPPLHIRRTLDQSHFLNLKDTSHRDQDQVVYRATRLPWYMPGNLARVVMVDQLWMWLLDDRMPSSSIATCSDFLSTENCNYKFLTGVCCQIRS